MLLGTNAAAMRADSIELVLVKCRVFHKSPVRAEDVCNPTIALGNLSHVRSQPHSCARNLELCDSVDAAETELAGLGNAILVETGNGDALLLDQLAARLARSNTTLLLGRQPGAGGQQPVGLVGEIELSGGFLPAQATAALDLSRECGGAPVLFAATRGFDLQDLRVLSELVVAAAVPTTVCMLAGIWHDPLLYQAAFVSNNFLLVVDPRGYGLDSELEDCQLAERCLPLLQQECARFVLGIHFSHAVQLRRYGGDGYLHTAKRFLSRLRMLGASPNELEGLCKTNALKALQYRQPIVQG
ncbi:hypothetical protein BASA81_005126 [Batrachochytrium salamandrivorans]|nr:hypothetical protein BASA81_005126 [Batrachochytrium salamandrivorans]